MAIAGWEGMLGSTASLDLLRRAAALTVYTADGARWPSKPLLVLRAVCRAQRGWTAQAPWSWWRDALQPLLLKYAPSGRANPHYPFRRLVGDDLWGIPELETLPQDAFVEPTKATGIRDFKLSWLNAADPQAGLPEGDHELLAADPETARRLVRLLLQRHFPPTTWQDILIDAGVEHDLHTVVLFPADVAEVASPGPPRRRATTFAAEVLAADERRCVVCGYDGADTGTDPARPVGLDAAHVRWWHVGGPDTLANGLALCATHHRLYDRGMYTFDPGSKELVISPRYAATRATDLPRGLEVPTRIDPAYLRWQRQNVFRAA